MFNIKRKNNKEQENCNKNYANLFYNVYKLACYDRNTYFDLSSCIIKDNENVLLQGNYKLNTTTDKAWDGLVNFHFYIFEKKNKKYLKMVDVLSLEEMFEFGGILYSNGYKNISWINEFDYGVFTAEYKKYARSITKEYELDDNFDKLLNEISKIDFKDDILEKFTCDYNISLLHYDCYDFYNKCCFIADGYCKEEYAAYVDLLDYIFNIANISYLVPSKIKKVKSLDIAYEEMVKRKEDIEKRRMMIE